MLKIKREHSLFATNVVAKLWLSINQGFARVSNGRFVFALAAAATVNGDADEHLPSGEWHAARSANWCGHSTESKPAESSGGHRTDVESHMEQLIQAMEAQIGHAQGDPQQIAMNDLNVQLWRAFMVQQDLWRTAVDNHKDHIVRQHHYIYQASKIGRAHV